MAEGSRSMDAPSTICREPSAISHVSARAIAVAALRLCADLRVAVDDDTIGALVEGQRAADRLALTLIDDPDRRAGEHVRFVGGGVNQLAALGLAALFAQHHILVRLRAIEFVARRFQKQQNAGG